MNVWSKLITALRGGANEAGEAIVDLQALRILDQEVRDATEELVKSRESLAEMMAREKVAEQKCFTLNGKITEFEDYAIQALHKNDESLAQELAEKIADLENQLNIEQSACDGYKSNADSLRKAIKQADKQIKELKHQVDTVRATENVQRAQAAVAQRHSVGDRPDRQRQEHHALRLAAGDKLRRREHMHRRGSGRVQPGVGQPVPGKRQGGLHVRLGPSQPAAAGPGYHHGRRNPRHRDRPHRRPGRPHRAPGAKHSAYQRCA